VQIASEVDVGTPVDVIVLAIGAAGRPAKGYSGAVAISCSDAGATLPLPVAFRPGNDGILVMSLTFGNAGHQTITVSDAAAALRATATVCVRCPSGRRRHRDVLDIWMAS
jgi:hypothetical protein